MGIGESKKTCLPASQVKTVCLPMLDLAGLSVPP